MNEEIMNVNVETEVEENYDVPAVQDEDDWNDDYVDGVYFDEESEPSGSTAKGVAIGLGITAAVGALAFGGKKLIDKLRTRKAAKQESEEIELSKEERIKILKNKRDQIDVELISLEKEIETEDEE